MSTRGKWGRWVQSLPAHAPEWTSTRLEWLRRGTATRKLPHLDLVPEQAAGYRKAYGVPPEGQP